MKGISHLAIGVSDMEQSLPFYSELLGLEVMLDAEHENYFRSSAENAKVADWLAE